MRTALLLISVAVLSYSQVDSAALQPAPMGLADAERSFSALSEREGIRNSFLAYLDDDCIMFNPHPVNGKELYAAGPASTSYLAWYPVFVEVAASGDFGISTGPWEIRASKNDTVRAYGYFFSVWGKKYGKDWKVTLDLGVGFPKEQLRLEDQHFRTLRRFSKKVLYPESAHAELKKVEKNFIQACRNHGPAEAYNAGSSDNLRVYREGYFPAVNKEESMMMIAKEPAQKDFIPLNTRIASSGDLGFTYGYAVNAQNDSSSYVRVWRKEKEWKVAVDILKPFKP